MVVLFAVTLKLVALVAVPVVSWLRVGTLAAAIVPVAIFDAFIAIILAPLPLNKLAFTVDANVATPATLTLSKFVCPSTSISPFKSIPVATIDAVFIVPAKVDTPATETLSKFV